MNLNKKILSVMISLWVIFSANASLVVEQAETMIEAANSLAAQWIINDHSDDTEAYNLNANVLRQEIAAVARWIAWLDKKSTCEGIFDDVSATTPNSWVCYSVEPLVDNNLISQNTLFRPEDNITKAEALWMLIKAIWFNYEYNSNSTKTWQEQIVDYASSYWLVEDFTDYDVDATRWWIFVIADTTLKKEEEIKEIESDEVYSDEVLKELEPLLGLFEY